MDSPLISQLPQGRVISSLLDGSQGNTICLAVDSAVTTAERVGGKRYNGRARVHYAMTVNDHAGQDLTVSHSTAPIGLQSADDARAALEAYSKNGGRTFGGIEAGLFDWRAVCFICGCVAARAITGQNTSNGLPTILSPRTLLSERSAALQVGEVVLTRALYRNDREADTLSMWLTKAGVSRVYFADATIPPSGATLDGHFAGQYAVELYLRISNAANIAACAGPHEAAFCSGIVDVLALHGHTREGGWIRGCLTAPEFPPPVGLIGSTAANLTAWPPEGSVSPDHLARIVLARLFGLAYCVGCADDGSLQEGHWRPTALTPLDNGVERPSSWSGFSSFCPDFYRNVVRKIEQLYAFTPCERDCGPTVREYLARDRPDRHFAVRDHVVFPGYWVTIDPLFQKGFPVPNYALQSEFRGTATVPMMSGGTIYKPKNGGFSDEWTRMPSGARYLVDLRHTSLREQGFRLLFSTQVNGDEDGLALFTQINLGQSNRDLVRPYIVRDSDHLDQQVLGTPYSAFALPFEGMIGQVPSAYQLVSDGRVGVPLPAELEHGKLKVMAGLLTPVRLPNGFELPVYPLPDRKRREFARKIRVYEAISLSETQIYDIPAFTTSVYEVAAVSEQDGHAVTPARTTDPGGPAAGPRVSASVVPGGVKPAALNDGRPAPYAQLTTTVPSTGGVASTVSAARQNAALNNTTHVNRLVGAGAPSPTSSRLASELQQTRTQELAATAKAVVDAGHHSLGNTVATLSRLGVHDAQSTIHVTGQSAGPSDYDVADTQEGDFEASGVTDA